MATRQLGADTEDWDESKEFSNRRFGHTWIVVCIGVEPENEFVGGESLCFVELVQSSQHGFGAQPVSVACNSKRLV